MLRTWKKEFLQNAGPVFNERQKPAEREGTLEEERTAMFKTIGQLMLESDFLQDCFRRAGAPVLDLHKIKP